MPAFGDGDVQQAETMSCAVNGSSEQRASGLCEGRADPDQLSLMTLGDEVLEQVCIPLASTPQIERALGECLPKDLPIQTQFLLVAVLCHNKGTVISYVLS